MPLGLNTQQSFSDTIVAAATPPGRAGVGIVRVSGMLAKNIAEKILKKIPTERFALFTSFYDDNQQVIDQGLALFFKAPHSFTGEDVLELQGHGSPIVIQLLIEQCISYGARLALPGEFSKRAFLNGKMDLVQVEAVADLIDAASREAASSALRSLQGVFSEKIHEVVNALIHLRTYIEASIDFGEEEIDFLGQQTIHTQAEKIHQQIEHIEQSAAEGSRLREGITIVITGKPNAGKSSLLNKLCRRDSAIVTAIPGTTRDILREQVMIGSLPVQLIDTAGLRESDDVIEQEGIRRAKLAMQEADVILNLYDIKEYQTNKYNKKNHDQHKNIYIFNKIDLIKKQAKIEEVEGETYIFLSALTGEGINLLEQKIAEIAAIRPTGEDVFSARRRHLIALEKAKNHVKIALNYTQFSDSVELLAEELRLAQLALSEITGEFSHEDLLTEIFSGFCIGK